MARLSLLMICVACTTEPSSVLRRSSFPAQSAEGFTGRLERSHSLEFVDGFAEMELDLPSDALSLLVEVEGDFDGEYLIHQLVGPQGALVVDHPESDMAEASQLGAAAGPFFSANRSVAARGGTTLLVPNDPYLVMNGGTYHLGIRSTLRRTHRVQLKTWVQTGTAYPQRCQLSVHIHRPTPLADDADIDDRILAAMTEMESIYEQAGIEVILEGLHQQDQLGSELPNPAVDLEPYRNAFVAGRDGLNLYVVDSIGDEEPPLGGFASAIPLSARANGLFSGVVVALGFSDPDQENDLLGYTMAHESAHGLGLFHVQEFTGWEDPLTDTHPDKGNNLLGVLARHQDRNVSASQALVMRTHPLCRSPGLGD